MTQTVRTRNIVARKRKCQRCGRAFTTQEIESAAGQLVLNERHWNTIKKRRLRKRFEEAMQREL